MVNKKIMLGLAVVVIGISISTSTSSCGVTHSSSGKGEVLATTEKPKYTTEVTVASEDVKKSEYLHKLKRMDNELSTVNMGDTMIEMKEAASNIYTMWDNMLNEVYGVLKTQLSEQEMESLREEQRQWITERDKKAKEAAAQFEGGTMEGLEYTSVLGSITRIRCYELVDEYMK